MDPFPQASLRHNQSHLAPLGPHEGQQPGLEYARAPHGARPRGLGLLIQKMEVVNYALSLWL